MSKNNGEVSKDAWYDSNIYSLVVSFNFHGKIPEPSCLRNGLEINIYLIPVNLQD